MDATTPQDRPPIEHRRIPARVAPRRRPSGEAPPLPHHLGRTGKFWLDHGGVLRRHRYRRAVLPGVRACLRALGHRTAAVAGRDPDPVAHRRDAGRGRARGELDAPDPPLGDVRRVDRLPAVAAPASCSSGAIIVARAARVPDLAWGSAAPRPFGVEILTDWTGYSMPSRPIAALAVTLFGMTYALVPAGRPRYLAKWASASCSAPSGFARTYLAVDQPHRRSRSARSSASTVGPIVAFRWFTPNDVVPRDVPARQDRAPRRRRGAAARRSCAPSRTSSASTVIEIKPVGLEGSGGSTPLRLTRRRDRGRAASGTSSRSSTRRTTSAPTAGTSSAARSCTARSRTRRRSGPSGGSSSTRTTRCA